MSTEDKSVFEHPLAERMRGFLRLEAALSKTRERMEPESTPSHRAALSSLAELAALTERNELKRDILSELERQRVLLSQLANSAEVDAKKLNQSIYVLEQVQSEVSALPQQLGRDLKANEFLYNLRSRSAIPGGSCVFDLPALHFWLALPAEQRRQDLEHWMADMAPVEEALAVLLGHIRQAAALEPVTAAGGIFEYSPPRKHPPLLLRIGIAGSPNVYPQVSGGKHRVTIQFQRWQGVESRPELMRENVDFTLAVCRL